MNGKGGNVESADERSMHLEEENKSLHEEIKTLRSNYEAALLKVEKQLAIEKKYEQSQERFRTIFEQSKFGGKIIAPDLQIIEVNKALQDMLGYSEKELEGSKITDYAHADYKDHWKELQECLWTNKIPSFQIETILLRKDGSSLWCGITTVLFKDQQATLGYTILEDISERKALEEKLQKQAYMVNTELENFIYTASHDLKSPIVNIEGLMIILTKKLNGSFSLDDEQNRMLSMIGASIDKLKSTIAYLTQIVKVQREEVADEVVSFEELIDEVYHDVSLLTAHIPIKVHKHLEAKEINFSRKSLYRIIYKLLSNGVNYHSPQRIPEVWIHTSLQDNQLVISVADNGIGIAEHHLQKLFTMFKRFHTGVEGTGIGLYMIKRIVENAGGKIEAESRLDKGTTFKVFLPYTL
jgi:two-component system sensor histidine kinase VicK